MKSFEQSVKEVMNEVVETHKWNHPLYYPTRIDKSIIDKDNKRAAFVLFEQIDTDRLMPEARDTLLNMAGSEHPLSQYMPSDVSDEGWLGDQFRYSVWFMKNKEKPKQLYEDHAYIRPRTISSLTGTRGRDCKISLEELTDNGIIVDISTEERKENDEYLRKKVLLDFNGKINPIPKKSKLKTYWLK